MKKKPRIDKSGLAYGVKTRVKEKILGMSEGHLKWVKKQPCVVTGFGPCDPHHLTRVSGGKRGMGKKNLDIYTIPLTRHIHDALHEGNMEIGFLREHAGIHDAPLYALTLAKGSPDPDIRAYAKELLKQASRQEK